MRPWQSPLRARIAPRVIGWTIGAAATAMFLAFVLPSIAHAASNPGNLVLVSAVSPRAGCPIGPALGFCAQIPGTTGPALQFNVKAKADVTSVDVAIAAIPGLSGHFAAGDFSLTSSTCAGSLAANQQCQMYVAFSPTASGLREAALNVTDSAGDVLTINIQGTGSQLALAPPAEPVCSPALLPDNDFHFCPEAIGATSATETFTLSSGSGGATGVNVTLAAIPGLASEFAGGDFTMVSTTCTGAISPGGNCTVGIAFSPTAAGLRSAVLTATDSSGNSAAIYLAGTATSGLALSAASVGGVPACAEASAFDYCNLPTGGLSTSNTFAFTNTSGTQITGLSVPTGSVLTNGATAPDFTVETNACASVLAAGASCNITVAFTPTAAGLRQGVITLTDAQGDIAAVNLAGVGDEYSFATQLPTEISVIPGGTATFKATLQPDYVFGMNGEQVTFTCPTNLPANTSCVVTPCPASVTPGMPVSVQMVLVTSSIKTVAPIPNTGCSSYGPSATALISAPPDEQPVSPAAGSAANESSPLYPALFLFAAFGALGLLVRKFAEASNAALRKRVPILFACLGLAAAILTGCHHHAPTNTTATPTGAANLTVQGAALDANGHSLNASRSFTTTLDVVTK